MGLSSRLHGSRETDITFHRSRAPCPWPFSARPPKLTIRPKTGLCRRCGSFGFCPKTRTFVWHRGHGGRGWRNACLGHGYQSKETSSPGRRAQCRAPTTRVAGVLGGGAPRRRPAVPCDVAGSLLQKLKGQMGPPIAELKIPVPDWQERRTPLPRPRHHRAHTPQKTRCGCRRQGTR